MANDYPIKELIAGAERAIAAYRRGGTDALVFFKATCPTCKQRPMFAEPNTIYERMECCSCGTTFDFERGNYALVAGNGVEKLIDSLPPTQDGLKVSVAFHAGTVLVQTGQKGLGAEQPGRPTRQYQEPMDDYLGRLRRWQTAYAPDELGDVPKPTPTSYACRACNLSWPYDPELDEPKLYCPNCGTQVEALEEG